LYFSIKPAKFRIASPYLYESESMDDREAMMHQMMLERMQMLEEALQRAEAGNATPDDWATIRYECNMPKRKITNRSEL